MIEAVIELLRNMMDVEALARESHVNPFQTGIRGFFGTVCRGCGGGNHSNEGVCIAVSYQLWKLELNKYNIPFPFKKKDKQKQNTNKPNLFFFLSKQLLQFILHYINFIL